MRLLVNLILIAACVVALAAAPSSQDDQYLVTLDGAAAVDRGDAVAAQLAAGYGGTVLSTKEATFVVRMSPSRVRALSADPRVTTVVPLRDVGANAIIEPVNWSVGVSYTYDGSGSVTAIGTDPASSDTFAYDDVGRLVQARVNGNTRTYNYDAFGNRLGCKHNVTTDCQHAIQITSSNNHIQGATYDPAGSGSVTKLGTHDYSYDAVNMMTRDHSGAGKFENLYTADDERLATYTANTASWAWTVRDPSAKVLREFSSTDSGVWQWTRDYVYRDELLLASVHPDGDTTKTHHYHLDHLGSARRVTNDADDIIGFHDYYAFGPEISGSLQEPSGTQLKFTGHEREPGNDELTLDYMHARFYNHTVGRFLSVDPARSGRQKVPQSWNRYAYAANDPMKYVDRNGQYYELATPADRQFFVDALTRGTHNKAARELLLRQAADPLHKIVLRTGALPGQWTYGDSSRLHPPYRTVAGNLFPSGITSTVDRGKLLLTNYPNPTITTYHELKHVDIILYQGLAVNASHPDAITHNLTTGQVTSNSIFEDFGRSANSTADDPMHALTADQVNSLIADPGQGAAKSIQKCESILCVNTSNIR